MPDYYAHSIPGCPKVEWQPLEEHLKSVAEIVRAFAENFGAGDCRYLVWTLVCAGLIGRFIPVYDDCLVSPNESYPAISRKTPCNMPLFLVKNSEFRLKGHKSYQNYNN